MAWPPDIKRRVSAQLVHNSHPFLGPDVTGPLRGQQRVQKWEQPGENRVLCWLSLLGTERTVDYHGGLRQERDTKTQTGVWVSGTGTQFPLLVLWGLPMPAKTGVWLSPGLSSCSHSIVGDHRNLSSQNSF